MAKAIAIGRCKVCDGEVREVGIGKTRYLYCISCGASAGDKAKLVMPTEKEDGAGDDASPETTEA